MLSSEVWKDETDNFAHVVKVSDVQSFSARLYNPKNTGAWKGRLKRFFVDPYTVELAKNDTNIIQRYPKNKQFLFYA